MYISLEDTINGYIEHKKQFHSDRDQASQVLR